MNGVVDEASSTSVKASSSPKRQKGERKFRPGLYAKVRVPIGLPTQALMVPEKALKSSQGNKSILVAVPPQPLKPGETAPKGKREYSVKEQPLTKFGPEVNGRRVVLSDEIKPGDIIITNGLQLIKKGKGVYLRHDPLDPAPEAGKKSVASAKP